MCNADSRHIYILLNMHQTNEGQKSRTKRDPMTLIQMSIYEINHLLDQSEQANTNLLLIPFHL